MMCVQVLLTVFITSHIEYSQLIRSPHRWYVICLCQLYSHIYNFLKLLSLYGSYLPLLAPFLPVLSASNSVFKEHGVLCVNVSVIITPHNANRSKRMQIPIYLAEMSPPAYRATFPGVAYQLGNVRHTFYFCFFFGVNIIHSK